MVDLSRVVNCNETEGYDLFTSVPMVDLSRVVDCNETEGHDENHQTPSTTVPLHLIRILVWV